MRLGHRGWVVVSGLIWLAIGSFLTYKGMKLTMGALSHPYEAPVLRSLGKMVGSMEQGALLFVGSALLLGIVKGRIVLARSVKRISGRIYSLSVPITLGQVYPSSYYVLIGSMMALGMSMNFLPIPLEVRGWIDLAVGSALINGAAVYFKTVK